MALPADGRLIAIDWGAIRTGLALSDEGQILASPLTTLIQRRGKRFPLKALRTIIEEHGPVGVVLGLPLTPEGGDSETTTIVRDLAASLDTHLSIPLELWDERFTTARALQAIREMGGRTRGRKADVDALAATVLLQHYLDSHRSVA